AALLVEQYNHFESRTLAVRGERLHLVWSRCANDEGFEAIHHHLHEVDDAGKIVYEGRFDEDDFDSAYGELERRFYAGEAAAFAESGVIGTDFTVSLNAGDLDHAIGDLCDPEMVVVNHSSSAFPDRSATEFRATLDALDAMVVSSRIWNSAMSCLSPTFSVVR